MQWADKTILIAEDEETNFLLLLEYLEPTGIKIIRASNGLEVLNLFNSTAPDLILMDIKMPKMTGIEATLKIRELNPSIPILAQTAYTLTGDKERLLACGCNNYIAKPIEEDALLGMIEMYLTS